MISQSNIRILSPREVGNYGFARAKDIAFDAVQSLWRRRRYEGMTQTDVIRAIGRDRAWVSRNLRAPGNWTLRTLGELAEALNGELEIFLHAKEDAPDHPSNYSAYVGYEPSGAVGVAVQGNVQVIGAMPASSLSAGQVIG